MFSDQANGQAGGLPIPEAAVALGISENALRKRVRRQTIPAYKQDDRWYVVVGDQADGLANDLATHETLGQATDQATTQPVARPPVPEISSAVVDLYRDALVAKDSEIEFLRDLLRREQDEREEAERRHADEIERRDVLLREALGRIQQLPSGLSNNRTDDDRENPPMASPEAQGEEKVANTTPDTSQSAPVVASPKWWEFWRR